MTITMAKTTMVVVVVSLREGQTTFFTSAWTSERYCLNWETFPIPLNPVIHFGWMMRSDHAVLQMQAEGAI